MAQDSQNTKYLFDFLYLDRDKLASYSAQLFENGSLTSIKSVSSIQNQVASKMHAGLPKIFGAEEHEQASTNESLERSFDAAWSLPLNVINALDANELINRDITKTTYGQLVMIKGTIQIIDLRLLQGLWDGMVKMMVGDLPTSTSAQRKKKQDSEAEARNIVSMISKLPHTLQFKVFNEYASIWSTLKPEHMVINPFDFAMKHGATISGEWFALGVVDAKPSDVEDIFSLPSASDLELGMLGMISQLKELMGRPKTDYGITPVAVFRKIE